MTSRRSGKPGSRPRANANDVAQDAAPRLASNAGATTGGWTLDPHDTREWLLMALESAGMGSWDWDVVTDVVRYISPFAGAGAAELRSTSGSAWFTMSHSDDVPSTRAQVDAVIEGKAESFSILVRMNIRTGGDGWAWIHSRGKAMRRDARGRALRMVGIFEDVTAEIMRERLARERERMLAHAGRLASLAALATSVAHELNQPLAALTSFLDASKRLLDAKNPDLGEIGHALERSAALAEKASEIVRRLRRLLRREQPLQEEIVLPAFLHQVRDAVANEALAAGVTVEVAGAADRVTLRGDAVQVEQALVNLVRNAIESFATSGPGSRRVRLGVVRAHGVVRVTVEDNGPGIPEGSAARVFEPFFTTKASGTGLGLVIAESIAEVHGGQLELERSDREGTRFALVLPMRSGQEGS